MKRFWSLILLCALVLSLFGCASSGLSEGSLNHPQDSLPDVDPSPNSSCIVDFIPPDFTIDNDLFGSAVSLNFQAQYIRTDCYIDGAEFPQVYVVRSLSELKDYYSAQLGTYANSRLQEALAKYDEAYFENQILIMVLLEEGSGSVRHEVTAVTKLADNQMNISIESIVPEVGTCDMAQWHILIEPEAGTDVESASNVFINGKGLYGDFHSLEVQGETHLLQGPLAGTYRAGETVTVRIPIVTDNSISLYLNGVPLEQGNTIADYLCLQYTFTMPGKESVLYIESKPVWPDPNYGLYYEVKELDSLSPCLWLREDSNEFAASYSSVSSFRIGGKYEWSDKRLILYVDGSDHGEMHVFAVEGDDLIYLVDESDAASLDSPMFFDGMIFSPAENPFTSNSNTVTFQVPPELKLVVDGYSSYAVKNGYSWTVNNGDGTITNSIADSQYPLNSEDVAAPFYVYSGTGTLAFEMDPDSFTIHCWSDQASGDTELQREDVTVSGYDIQLKPGGYIYEVNAAWETGSENFCGTARYYLYVFYSDSPTENTVIDPEDIYPSATDHLTPTAGGPDECLVGIADAAAYDVMHYLTAARSETLRDILYSLSYNETQVCRCAPEYILDDGYGIRYGLNLSEGFIRCEDGQAALSEELIVKIRSMLAL